MAIELLKTLPISGRMIKQIHKVLMTDTRGAEKYPGEFRHTQNWIGGTGVALNEAHYIPPNPDDMIEAISNLEMYINAENDDTDELIKIALIHYQFETIHPFLDGNGRVGRLLIPLYLISKGLLTSPSLYISYYLKKNRVEYYDRMTEVRRKGDYEQWIKFFLRALIISSENAINTIRLLTKLHDNNVKIVKNMKRISSNTLKVFLYMERNPITTIGRLSNDLGLSFSTASRTLKRLQGVGILSLSEKIAGKTVYYYKKYLDTLKQGTEYY